jgi:hypothetical protein
MKSQTCRWRGLKRCSGLNEWDRGDKIGEDIMTSGSLNWTRRKFILVSAAGVAVAPLLTNLSGPVPGAKAAEEPKTVKKENIDWDDLKCRGCQMCTIFYSNCLAVNNRVCWCEPAREELT